MSENLFAYTDVNSGYSAGAAGAIYGDRTAASSSAFQAVKNKIINLKGDPAFFNFFQGLNSRLVLRQYNYSTTNLLANQIVAPQGTWSSPLATQTWTGAPNLHGVATSGKWLFTTDYDASKMAVVNTQNNLYTQVRTYTFPTDFSGFTNPYSDGVYHGEALAVSGSYLYALFYVNQGSGYSNYYNSIIAKFSINTTTGALTYDSYVTAGKNSFTLDLYDNKLYVCSLGGMQNAGSGNADTELSIIDLTNFTQSGVTNVTITNPTTNGDFRDISILNASHAYVFLGHYDSNYTNMVGGIYHTTAANLTSPSNWTKVVDVNALGYLWGVYADAYRLWFVQGTPIAIYDGSPTSLQSAASKTFSISDMSDYSNGNLNSACFIAPDATTGLKAAAPGTAPAAKSLASQLRLAREAKELADRFAAEKK
jgi:hypothetical protein